VKEITSAGGTAVAVAESVTSMEGGQRIVQTAVDNWGSIDGVVCIAGILRERMLFNMSEDEWDAVIETHMKGHFTVFRAAAAVMRKQQSGSLIGFTSGAFTASVAAGMYRYGVTANCVAPVARTRMSANVPQDLAEMGDPEDVAPLVVYLLSDQARHITGQIYTAVGNKIAVWNQPREVRAMYADGRWTADQIGQRLDSTIGQERMAILDALEAMRQAAASGAKPNT